MATSERICLHIFMRFISMLKKVLLVFFFLFGCLGSASVYAVDTLSVAPQPEPLSEAWRWCEFQLPGSNHQIFEDRDGIIWFSTYAGLVKYDGHTFKTLTVDDGLAGKTVVAMAQTSDGVLWATTRYNGISRIEGDSIRSYGADEGIGYINYGAFKASANGGLWAGGVGENAGLHYFDGHVWTAIQMPANTQPIRSLVETSDGVLWAATDGSGILRYQAGNWTQFGGDVGLPSMAFNNIIQASDGAIWATVRYDQAIVRYKDHAWTVYTTQDGLRPDLKYASVWEDADGHIWSASHDGNFIKFVGDRWVSIASPELMAVVSSEVLTADLGFHGTVCRDGSLWVYSFKTDKAYRIQMGTHRAQRFDVGHLLQGGIQTKDGTWFATAEGPVRFDGQHWFLYGQKEGLAASNYVPALAVTDDGSVWFLGRGGGWNVYRFLDGRWDVFPYSWGGLDRGAFASVRWRFGIVYREQDQSIWVAGGKGNNAAVSRYDGNTWQVFDSGIAVGRVRAPFVAKNGDIWFVPGNSGDGGVIRFDPSASSGQAAWTQYTTEDGLLSNSVLDFGQSSDGRIWAGTELGLNWFDPLAGGEAESGQAMWQSYGLGMPGDEPFAFQSDGENLWCSFKPGDAFGLWRYDGHQSQIYPTNAEVRHILPADDGTLWVASTAGIGQLDPKTGIWANYTTAEGIAPGPVQALWQTEDGMGYTSGTGMAGIIRPNKGAPKSAFVIAPTDVDPLGNVLLTWSARDLWDVTPADRLHYQYRLDGGDWSPPLDRTDLMLTSLSSGTHRIELRAIDSELNVELTPSVHSFVVASPWWWNPWIMGCAIVALGIIGLQTGRVVLRDRQLRETNVALSDANKELFGLNKNLQQKTEDLAQSNSKLEVANREIQTQTERKSAFLASMSHELRTPMNAIKGFANLVQRREPNLTDRGKENLEKVGQASDHLLAMINDLLDLSKIEAGRMDVNPSTFDVHKLVRSCVSTVEPLVQDGVSLSCDVEEGIGEVHTDEARLRQMVINLTSNAIKFTERGEVRVTIASHRSQVAGQNLNGNRDSDLRPVTDFLEISVSDTGQGIPEDELATIFDEYRQVKGSDSVVQKGTGLGLSITKKFAELLGGSVGVRSEVGKGSVFTVKIPLLYQETN